LQMEFLTNLKIVNLETVVCLVLGSILMNKSE
jgi:hypothetical protein